jgi:hypothetical protein
MWMMEKFIVRLKKRKRDDRRFIETLYGQRYCKHGNMETFVVCKIIHNKTNDTVKTLSSVSD